MNTYFKKTNSQRTKYHATTSRALDSAAYHDLEETVEVGLAEILTLIPKGSEVPDHSHDTNAVKHKAMDKDSGSLTLFAPLKLN